MKMDRIEEVKKILSRDDDFLYTHPPYAGSPIGSPGWIEDKAVQIDSYYCQLLKTRSDVSRLLTDLEHFYSRANSEK